MGGGGLLIFYVTNETNETNVRPPKSPLKPIKGSLKGRYSPDGSGLKIHPPLIIGRTCPTTCQKM